LQRKKRNTVQDWKARKALDLHSKLQILEQKKQTAVTATPRPATREMRANNRESGAAAHVILFALFGWLWPVTGADFL